MSRADKLLTKAQQVNARIATAESCTAGLIAGAITDVAGSSNIFDRGFITYSNAAKMAMIGVQAASLDQFGAVSPQVAAEMAEGALLQSDATLAISVTGIAGPGGSDHKPEGRVCFGLAKHGQVTLVETKEFGPLGRTAVRQATVDHALDLLIHAISNTR